MSTTDYGPLKAATGRLARLLLDPAPDIPRWRESLDDAAGAMEEALREAGLCPPPARGNVVIAGDLEVEDEPYPRSLLVQFPTEEAVKAAIKERRAIFTLFEGAETEDDDRG